MNFCRCEKRKFDKNDPELQSSEDLVCPVCRQIIQCGECPKPAQYLDVYGEPKGAAHDSNYLI